MELAHCNEMIHGLAIWNNDLDFPDKNKNRDIILCDKSPTLSFQTISNDCKQPTAHRYSNLL